MSLQRGSYPQVDHRAEGLMTRSIVVVPEATPLEEAARVVRRRRARLLVARVSRRWEGALPSTLEAALGLGLHAVRVGALLWGAPVVAPATPEVEVRRRLGPADPFAVVAEGERAVGAVLGEEEASWRVLPRSACPALARAPDEVARVLRVAGALGGQLGWPVAAVGGFVRDLIRTGAVEPRADLDVAVEGDGREFARRLWRALGGSVVDHPVFLTATLTLPDGRRVDVATARRERYPIPGALPQVEPATLAADLARRDFSVNAMAVRLDGTKWGEIVDPSAGAADLDRRRIRVLHPLSFVEDPTRIFRAVRFVVRLGFRLEPRTRRLLRAAASLPVYHALSGERLQAELDAVLTEPAPAETTTRLGRLGAFRVVLREYAFPREGASLLREVAAAAAGMALAKSTVRLLYLLALTAHLKPGAARAWVDRLHLSAPVWAALERAQRDAPTLLTMLARVDEPSDAYSLVREVPEVVLAWAFVNAGGRRTRRYIGEHLRRWRTMRPLLTGDDLRALGLGPGPPVGRLLARLLAAQVAGRLRNREEALRWVRRALAPVDAVQAASRGTVGMAHRGG